MTPNRNSYLKYRSNPDNYYHQSYQNDCNRWFVLYLNFIINFFIFATVTPTVYALIVILSVVCIALIATIMILFSEITDAIKR
jgi:hypothetical protein